MSFVIVADAAADRAKEGGRWQCRRFLPLLERKRKKNLRVVRTPNSDFHRGGPMERFRQTLRRNNLLDNGNLQKKKNEYILPTTRQLRTSPPRSGLRRSFCKCFEATTRLGYQGICACAQLRAPAHTCNNSHARRRSRPVAHPEFLQGERGLTFMDKRGGGAFTLRYD